MRFLDWLRANKAALVNLLSPEPGLYEMPDMTGGGLSMDYWIGALGKNELLPSKGDVVVKIDSCSMGVTVDRDTRYRVVGSGRFAGSVIGETSDGKQDTLHVFYMRRSKLPRTWVLCN